MVPFFPDIRMDDVLMLHSIIWRVDMHLCTKRSCKLLQGCAEADGVGGVCRQERQDGEVNFMGGQSRNMRACCDLLKDTGQRFGEEVANQM